MGVRAVFLVGFMASGKSSVGQELARRLGWDFVDLDAQIESRERQTIPEIFRDRGEHGFRLAETSALRDLTDRVAEPQHAWSRSAAGLSRKKRTANCFGSGHRFSWKRPHRTLATQPGRTAWNGRCEEIRTSSPDCTRNAFPSIARRAWLVETTGKALASICAEIESALQLTRKLRKTRGRIHRRIDPRQASEQENHSEVVLSAARFHDGAVCVLRRWPLPCQKTKRRNTRGRASTPAPSACSRMAIALEPRRFRSIRRQRQRHRFRVQDGEYSRPDVQTSEHAAYRQRRNPALRVEGTEPGAARNRWCFRMTIS